MLNESISEKPLPRPLGPRQRGLTVTNPRAQLALALKNNSYMDSSFVANPLAQALAKKKSRSKKG